MSDGKKLSVRQRMFVQAYVRLGGMNATQAAIAAGYGIPGAHVSAHRLLRRNYILEAIRAETERALKANVAIGAQVLQDLAQGAGSESVKLQAALALLDRGGLPLVNRSEHRHILEDRRSDAELIERIARLAQELGLSAKIINGHLVTDPEAILLPPGSSRVEPRVENQPIEAATGAEALLSAPSDDDTAVEAPVTHSVPPQEEGDDDPFS